MCVHSRGPHVGFIGAQKTHRNPAILKGTITPCGMASVWVMSMVSPTTRRCWALDGLMTGVPRPIEIKVDSVCLLQCRNLRDLGGLHTHGAGLVVRPGCLFRSSTPSEFDPEEWRAISDLQLRSFIDLRTSAEVARFGVSVFAADVQSVHLPLFQNARHNWIGPADQSPRATALRYFEMLQDGLSTIAAVITLVARPDAAPCLVSCSAGRDRTGIVVACLLELLDITDEAIATDYARSDSFDQQSGRALADTIHELFALVRRRHGSVQQLLAPQGVTNNICQALRREYLLQPQ